MSHNFKNLDYKSPVNFLKGMKKYKNWKYPIPHNQKWDNSQFVSSEPCGSNFGWFASWRDRSDPAAYAKHYMQDFARSL